ncbi:MAG: Tungsten-containing aldehyde ferredoxin oxidoreductase [Methanoregula sp. PtaU1.Bin006]|uniref:aldehyde ferredoxin oxidoreductase family protein n=1 Tax=Methanoregula sp. PtaU1.Bin006 TaxID=1811681 RepID=UPI0009D0E96E|nr:aldehyde ferredoxin oxidoreductase family protein [Methanoregula sp. PtaU1.Bin006]OPY32827.1 MAG: Tungsten-containing aldehyde ferredoxin oxidoreductase [Methanoregula sp. PtaU1.Bin006]
MDGYTGKMVYADLSAGTVTIQATPPQLRQQYLGGRGFGIRLLTDMVDPKTDPLSEKNVLVVATGPLTGIGTPLGSRYEISALSPLSNTAFSANSGGVFGWKMKKAGFDAVVVTGRAEKPVWLLLDNGKAEIRDATALWGKTTGQTTDAIQADLKDQTVRVACIGPAGEKLVRFACLINEKTRAAGRGGGGAVMGSKNLKAIAARGDLPIRPADEEALKAVNERVKKKLAENGIEQALQKYGTAVLVNIVNENYVLPTRNFQSAHFPAAEKVSGETMAATILKQNKGCYSCTVKCGRVCEFDGEHGEGPEYEPDWAFGPDCGIDDLKAVARANNLCNEYGLDAISTPTTIACLMEMAEKGYVNHPVRFGDAKGMLALVEQIGKREGIGNELAEGSFRFATKYGHPDCSISSKMQELPAYDPRGIQGYGLAVATSNRGGDHVYGYLISPEVLGSPQKLDPYALKDKPQWAKTFQDLTAAIDASGMCLFSSFALGADDYADLVSAATGVKVDAAGLLKIGERIWNLQKLYNIRRGFGRKDDTLPARLLKEPLKEGAPAGQVSRIGEMLDEYYTLRGWDREGTPSPGKLKELGL